jgi:hypothetical protein
MSNKILLTFGDSWPAGAALPDKSLAFPKALAKNLEMTLQDLSEPATSIDHAVMAMLHFLENSYVPDNKYTALFCLTDASRNMAWREGNQVVPNRKDLWAPNCYTQELQINNNDPMSPVYFKHIHSLRLEQYNYHKNVVLLKLLCDKHNIKDFFVHNFYNPEFEFKIINTDRMYAGTLSSMLESDSITEFVPDDINFTPALPRIKQRQFTNKQYLATGGHPSVQGHEKLAVELTKWMKLHDA